MSKHSAVSTKMLNYLKNEEAYIKELRKFLETKLFKLQVIGTRFLLLFSFKNINLDIKKNDCNDSEPALLIDKPSYFK